YRAGLVIKSATDIENICTCRESREWGTLCAHSVGVGLHYLNRLTAHPGPLPVEGRGSPSGGALSRKAMPAKTAGASLQRSETGEPLEVFVILPPNLEQAITKGKIMVCLEGKWSRGRSPLNALPKSESFRLSELDYKL